MNENKGDVNIETYNQDGLRGYQALVRFMVDRATLRAVIIPVEGINDKNEKVSGFYVDVTSHGS